MESIKTAVVSLLNAATARYIRRNNIKVIAVAGSIGKTSTVSAIRVLLAQKYRVHMPKTAYNTSKSVHLEIFDQNFATSTFGWLQVTFKMLAMSLRRTDTEVIVIEIGTDHPGEMADFAFLQPDIGVLTAISPEHMEHFKDMAAVAEEELVITGYCRQLVYNADTVDRQYVPEAMHGQIKWYGGKTANTVSNVVADGSKLVVDFEFDGGERLAGLPVAVFGAHSLQALLAAGTVGRMCGLSDAELSAGLQAVRPVKGRMQPLAGIGGSLIIDDSYNASPDATKAALDTLYGLDVNRRVVILGSMNEMGDYSPTAHREVGEYCDPSRLDLVATIGADAKQYLAEAAAGKGCRVQSFMTPYQAGAYVSEYLMAERQPGTSAVLVKGSQNRVFAEESIKVLLADPTDVSRLVRQSDYWMKQKRSQFGGAE